MPVLWKSPARDMGLGIPPINFPSPSPRIAPEEFGRFLGHVTLEGKGFLLEQGEGGEAPLQTPLDPVAHPLPEQKGSEDGTQKNPHGNGQFPHLLSLPRLFVLECLPYMDECEQSQGGHIEGGHQKEGFRDPQHGEQDNPGHERPDR